MATSPVIGKGAAVSGVGPQTSTATWDQIFHDLAVGWRNIAIQTQTKVQQATAVGSAQAFMQSQGYDNGTANPNNPGSMTNAAYAAALIGYLTTLSGVVLGTANQPSNFNFANQMAPVMGGDLWKHKKHLSKT